MDNKDLLYFDRLWAESSPQKGMRRTQESWNRLAEDWRKAPKSEEEQKDRMRVDLAQWLQEKGVIDADSCVVDIGCGFGGSSRAFAPLVRQVTSADISPQMLHYAREFNDALGLRNIDYAVCDFRTDDIEHLGWCKKFDLVFTSMLPALHDLEAVRKINSISRRWCFNNNFIYRRDSLRSAVLENVFHLPAPAIWRGDSTYCLFNILWLLNLSPEITYYTEIRTNECELNMDLARSTFSDAIRDREPSPDELRQVYDYLAALSQDGKITKHVETKFVWTLWQAEEGSID